MCTSTETQGSCWGFTNGLCVFSAGDLWACVRKEDARRGRTWSKAFFPMGRMSYPFVSCCPLAKLLLAEEFWLVGVAGARNYLPSKESIPRSPDRRQG